MKVANPMTENSATRCHHRTANGNRCTMLVSADHPTLCATHAARLQKAKDSENVAKELLGEIIDLNNAVDINVVLSRLFTMLAEGRITPRRAAVLTYMANLLLRTLPAMDRELNPQPDDDAVPEIRFDMPPSPEHAELIREWEAQYKASDSRPGTNATPENVNQPSPLQPITNVANQHNGRST